MQIDENTIQKLRALDGARLHQLLMNAGTRAGVNPQQMQMLLGNEQRVQQMLSRLSAADVNKLLNLLGPQASETVLRSLGDELK